MLAPTAIILAHASTSTPSDRQGKKDPLFRKLPPRSGCTLENSNIFTLYLKTIIEIKMISYYEQGDSRRRILIFHLLNNFSF